LIDWSFTHHPYPFTGKESDLDRVSLLKILSQQKLEQGRKPGATAAMTDAHSRLYHKRLSRDPDPNAINTRIRRRCGTGRRATKGKQ
jgi:hypothetical protein